MILLTAQQSPNCLHFVFIVFVMPGTSLQSLGRGGCQDQADYSPGYTLLPLMGMGNGANTHQKWLHKPKLFKSQEFSSLLPGRARKGRSANI